MKKSNALGLMIVGLLGACTPTIYNRGHEVPSEKLALLKPNETTKEEVAELIGTPSSVAPFNNKTWYYIWEKTEQVSFLSPTVLEGGVVTLSFDESNRLTKVHVADLEGREKIPFTRRETPTSGHTFGLMEQMLGNVGRFNDKDPDSDRPL